MSIGISWVDFSMELYLEKKKKERMLVGRIEKETKLEKERERESELIDWNIKFSCLFDKIMYKVDVSIQMKS